jgi:hypothetical protein
VVALKNFSLIIIMFDTIELPTWFVAVAAVFASIAAIERALIPSVRWFFSSPDGKSGC